MPLSYIPNTDADRAAMLRAIGVDAPHDLFTDIPAAYRDPALRLPPPLSELELKRELGRIAARNAALDGFGGMPSFLGGGVYRHFIPSVVGSIVARAEFYTAYTPYQPEISQGTLQYTYELQSMLCQLTGMDVANAGMYDGATAAGEAALMAARLTGRQAVAVFSTVAPNIRDVVATYCSGPELAVREIAAGGPPQVGGEVACVLVQQPNAFGYLEDLGAWGRAAHAAGALLVVSVDPISLGLFRPPADYGADIVVGEAQALGNAPNFGGPYLGIFTCREQFLRQMPGRIVGRTTDAEGRTGYVMTLQTREQHIRRERATSNICTSQALVALAATVYLACLGPRGLRQIAELCYHKAHYAAALIAKLPGFELAFDRPFFKEFVVRCPVAPAELNRRLLE
ncbi:MAG: aminomethyl-transferring glycine dehydrogenase subunit GcvPA, partial [Chloroflexi bacterium]|nr:aminomethyl-transferring glycine dehydrogenase subunit GcvPA [Chloroflexota bacterium]